MSEQPKKRPRHAISSPSSQDNNVEEGEEVDHSLNKFSDEYLATHGITDEHLHKWKQLKSKQRQFSSKKEKSDSELLEEVLGIEDKKQRVEQNKRIQNIEEIQKHENQIQLNIGGTIFSTTKPTLCWTENFFRTMLQGDFPVDRDENGAITVDREPHHFPKILKFLQTKSSLGLIPEDLNTLTPLLKEAEFYNVSALVKKLRQKKRMIQAENRIQLNREIHQQENDTKRNDDEEEIKMIQDKVGKIDLEEQYLDRIQDQHNNLHKTSFQVLNQKKKELDEEAAKNQSKIKAAASENLLTDDSENTLISLNVSGKKFVVDLLSLARVKESLFAQSINALQPVPKEIYIDRDPELFHIIVEYLVNGSVSAINIPKTKEQKEKLLQEARYYCLPYFEELFDNYRYPLETIGKKNIKMKYREDVLRQMFVSDRNNPALSDPYLNLIPVFFHKEQFDSKHDEELSSLPMMFDYTNPEWMQSVVSDTICRFPGVAKDFERFQDQFNDFTLNMFDGLNWSNIFAAGGSILACTLEQHRNTKSYTSSFLDLNRPDPRELEQMSDSDSDYYSTDEEERDQQDAILAAIGDSTTRQSKHPHRSSVCLSVLESGKYNFGPWKGSDVDLFLYDVTEKEAEEKIDEIYNILKNNTDGPIFILRTEAAITFQPKPPYRAVQVILRIYKSPAEILMGFDIDCVCVGYDGHHVWALPRARRAIAHGINLVDVDRQSTTYEYRLYKYVKRGFRVAVPGLDRSRIPSFGSTPILLEANRGSQYKTSKGLERLLLLEDSLQKNQRESLANIGLSRSHAPNSDKKTETKAHDEIETKHSDYCSVFIPCNMDPREIYQNFQYCVSRAKQFKDNNWESDFAFALDDLESIKRPDQDASELPPKLSFITIDPGRQSIGSFNPVDTNFYKDAYESAELGVGVRSQPQLFDFYSDAGKQFKKYNNQDQKRLNRAYHEGKKICRAGPHHYVVFAHNKQFSKHDVGLQREVRKVPKDSGPPRKFLSIMGRCIFSKIKRFLN